MRIITVFIGCDFKKSDCFVLGCCCNIEFLYRRKVEYLNDRKELLLEFNRLLEKNGFISIIKHNRAGKIMQKAVFEYDIDEAWKLLENGDVESANFGTIKEYDDYELEEYCRDMLKIHKVYGLRIFYALQRNELKTEEEWLSNMYALECRAEEVPEFRDIAFFHHIILRQGNMSIG